MPPYRSVIIEKHTNNAPKKGGGVAGPEQTVKTVPSQVKFSPPMQPAKVMNTIISSKSVT
jgi:hypothetical protein